MSEFDIASYFDTIDHNILHEILLNTFKIDNELLKLLSKCLETWTADSNHATFKSKHGIPQGPIGSPFLADLYLFYLDTEFKKVKSLDFKYIRYVDDMRIFSKDVLTSQKLIAALDLISRDLGLIPQSSKILIKEVTDIDKELKLQNSKFSEIAKEYKEDNRYTFEKHRHWLVNYYMIPWLFHNDKKDLLLTETNTENHFIQRQLNTYKYIASSDNSYRKIFATKLLSNADELIALQGLNLLFNNIELFLGFKPSSEHHHFIKYIFTKQPSDAIDHTLRNHWKIKHPENFFNRSIWLQDLEYDELRTSFTLFIKSAASDPSKALLNLNIFNNLIFDKVCQRLNLVKVSGEFGVNLNANLIEKKLPMGNKVWMEINEKRNQKTEAHPYDKFGNIRLRIVASELAEILRKEMLTIEELCEYQGWS